MNTSSSVCDKCIPRIPRAKDAHSGRWIKPHMSAAGSRAWQGNVVVRNKLNGAPIFIAISVGPVTASEEKTNRYETSKVLKARARSNRNVRPRKGLGSIEWSVVMRDSAAAAFYEEGRSEISRQVRIYALTSHCTKAQTPPLTSRTTLTNLTSACSAKCSERRIASSL